MPARPIVLLMPGQGAQHPGMAVELYDRETVFTAVMDEFFALMGDEGRWLRGDWLSDRPDTHLDDASRAQPLLFAIDYALGRTIRSYGLQPAGLLGHSVGELAAATLAEVMDLAAAARVMLSRSAAMADTPPGGILAVAAAPEQLRPFLGDSGVVVGALNAPLQTILVGAEPHLSAVERALTEAQVPCRRVPSRQPFHCPAVDAAAVRFGKAFADERLRPPTTPIWSTRTARPVQDGEAVDPAFWAGQLAAPVLFWPALDELLAVGGVTLVEAGPGQSLSMLARRHPTVRRGSSEVVPLLPSKSEGSWTKWEAALAYLLGR